MRKFDFGQFNNKESLTPNMTPNTKAGLQAEKEKKIQVYYDTQLVGDYMADIIVEDKVILELKSVKELHPAHSAQFINYLKATGIEIGLLINFGESMVIKRKVFTPPKDCS